MQRVDDLSDFSSFKYSRRVAELCARLGYPVVAG